MFTPRTIQTVINEMLADKAARTELDILTNPSNVSIWYNLLAFFATETNIIENLGVELFDAIDSRALEIPVGTLQWHTVQTKDFQYGDTLTVINGIPTYSVIDTDKQIVKVASSIVQNGIIIIKVAKFDINSNPIPLSSGEKSALEQYWISKRFAGVFLSIVSQNADIMQLKARIIVDGQIISATGESQTVPGEYPVEVAITNYLKSLPFDGKLQLSLLVDAIQSVNGVSNVIISECLAKQDSGIYTNVLNNINQTYNSIAGYIVPTTETGLTLRDLLTYAIL